MSEAYYKAWLQNNGFIQSFGDENTFELKEDTDTLMLVKAKEKAKELGIKMGLFSNDSAPTVMVLGTYTPLAPPPAEEIATVNVLTLSGGVPQAIKSWPDTPAGNKSAEQYFKSLIKNAGCPEEDLETVTEDGTYEAEPTGFDFFLTHSD